MSMTIQFGKLLCIKEVLLRAKKLLLHFVVHAYKDVSHNCLESI